MKKLLALTLTVVMLFTLTACGNKTTLNETTDAATQDTNITDTVTPDVTGQNIDMTDSKTSDIIEPTATLSDTETTVENSDNANTTVAETEDDLNQSVDTSVSDEDKDASESTIEEDTEYNGLMPIDILNAVWDNYPSNKKFVAGGGNSMDGPGEMVENLDNAEMIESILLLPAKDYDKVADTACLLELYNIEFTCGVYRVVNSDDIDTIALDIKENIINDPTTCEYSDKFFVATYDNCVISAFGHNWIMNTFRPTLTETYPEINFVYEGELN